MIRHFAVLLWLASLVGCTSTAAPKHAPDKPAVAAIINRQLGIGVEVFFDSRTLIRSFTKSTSLQSNDNASRRDRIPVSRIRTAKARM